MMAGGALEAGVESQFRWGRILHQSETTIVREAVQLFGAALVGVRPVAVKRLLASDPASASAFAREARVAGYFEGEHSHPNIALVLSAGPAPDRIDHIVTRRGGEPLPVAKARSLGEALEIAMRLASAVAHVHQAGYVWDGAYPANVLHDDRTTQIVDFGGAVEMAEQAGEVAAARIAPIKDEAIPFTAPERLATSSPSVATDLYGVAAILFMLLTGEPPCVNAGSVSNAAPDPRAYDPALPTAVVDLVARALAPDPVARLAAFQGPLDVAPLARFHQELRLLHSRFCEPTDRLWRVTAMLPALVPAPPSDDARFFPVARRVVVHPRLSCLDFGEIGPLRPPAPLQIVVESASRSPGSVSLSHDWLVVSRAIFERGRTEIEVRVDERQLAEGDHARGWLDLLVADENGSARLPVEARVVGGVDLVCLVDMTGTTESVSARLAFARELAREAEAVWRERGLLRVGAILYGDYTHTLPAGRAPSRDGIVRLHPFAAPAAALDALADAPPMRAFDVEGALDEALDVLHRQARWRARGRKIVVTLGCRPPHPAAPLPNTRQIRSPRGHDWLALWRATRGRHRPLSVSVVWPLPGLNAPPAYAPAYASAVFQEIGVDGCFDHHAVSPDGLARRLAERLTQD